MFGFRLLSTFPTLLLEGWVGQHYFSLEWTVNSTQNKTKLGTWAIWSSSLEVSTVSREKWPPLSQTSQHPSLKQPSSES